MNEEIKCEDCEYFDKENDNCTYLACDGLDCEDAPCDLRLLSDYYEYSLSDEDGIIIVNGKPYEYEMTMSTKVPDSKCCRVLIDGNFYYFG